MPSTKDNLLTFLNSKTHPHISWLDEIEELFYFSIYWNFVENGSSEAQYDVIRNFIDSKVASKVPKIEEYISTVFEYFHQRYNLKEYDFNVLPRDGNTYALHHQNCKAMLLQPPETLSINDKIEFVAYVISRFRNRLFHGQKHTSKDQNENFKVINTFLHYLLTH